jgi:molybdopterin/thiamine biosynthesis adenylyltransferase
MNNDQLNRYSRHILLPQVDYDGQSKIIASHVLILGVGGLGSSASLYLASSGIGTITLCDFDHVEESNLQRQVVHCEASIGDSKVASAARTLKGLNSGITVNTYHQPLSQAELTELIKAADVVLDCTDNSASRCLHNRLCLQQLTPLVSAAAIRFEGQLMVIDPKQTEQPCYQCVYPEFNNQEESCSQSGILAPVVGMMGVQQALEAIKIITGIGDNMAGKLISFDALSSRWNQFNVTKNNNCPACGAKPLTS